LISPDKLVETGLLSSDDLKITRELPDDRVDYSAVIASKNALLYRAFENFRHQANAEWWSRVESFYSNESSWLDDYALFRALKAANGSSSWSNWPYELAKRNPDALASARESYSYAIEAQKFYQFLFFDQWFKLKEYCKSKRIQTIGDIPIFVAYDSADVWTNPEMFKLDESGQPTAVAGVPPDYFSATGQFWGNPLYDWEKMQTDGFKWWIERLRATLRFVDAIRLDHFRGFAACWEIPAGDTTAENGKWVTSPGRELFDALIAALGRLPIIAEDLGVITPDVEALRDDYGFPGMRILQFAFSSDTKNHDLPHNYIHNTVVYTGTHDNDTTVGWFNSEAGTGSVRSADQIERERTFCLKYLPSDGKEIHWDFVRTVMASVADVAIVPMQDLLGLGSEARMNLPASSGGNWSWRFHKEALKPELSERLKELSAVYGRNLVESPAIEADQEVEKTTTT
jgi:4-alpha-glucanotransferase